MRHFLDLLDLSADELLHLLRETARLKTASAGGNRTPVLQGRVLGLVFEKPSLRTRASFQSAMAQLGGSSVFMTGGEAGMGTRESIPDFARVMSQYVDAVVLRTFSHQTVQTFAEHSICPVINGLSDRHHPCQALADLFTLQEIFGDLKGRTIAFIGDGNNVARSLAICCGKLGVRFVLAAPEGYGFDKPFLEMFAQHLPADTLVQNGKPGHAVERADVIYTDVWTSMGQEAERELRARNFADYQVNEQLLTLAPAHARVMHCLPAHRGEEVTDAVLDGERSVVVQQAGNRLHAQKALLKWLLTETE
ncbi:MAG TPA: ornithine carbamoyltransferase [Gemmataceae bacterium]|jgi:ornithine carbamoyltransferase|nr:ornithine carbamoyltransferase [Gemmataceae bacterium]